MKIFLLALILFIGCEDPYFANLHSIMGALKDYNNPQIKPAFIEIATTDLFPRLLRTKAIENLSNFNDPSVLEHIIPILNNPSNYGYYFDILSLAKELNVPVLALSQLSRATEQRDDKRPQLSDLRESGSIEQDADVVMFVYREEYYLERKEPKLGSIEHAEWQSKMNEILGSADIMIGKQRHGPTGNVKVEFEAIYTKFKDAQKT